jgi:hypothetical protein
MQRSIMTVSGVDRLSTFLGHAIPNNCSKVAAKSKVLFVPCLRQVPRVGSSTAA